MQNSYYGQAEFMNVEIKSMIVKSGRAKLFY